MNDELRQGEDQDFGADTERFRKFARSDQAPEAAPSSGGLPVPLLVGVGVAVVVLLVLVALVVL